MQEIIIDIMDKFGYVGVALLIAVENIFPPIPSEIILTFGGFMTTYTDLDVWLMIFAATVGSVIGACTLYLLGRILNEERLERWLSGKWGKILHLKAEDVRRADKWFKKRGKFTVFICRFIPIVRSLISVPAGMAKMKFGSFLALTTAGTAIWNTVLIWLGVFAGGAWEQIVGYIGIYSDVLIGLVALAAIIFLIIFYKKRIKKQ